MTIACLTLFLALSRSPAAPAATGYLYRTTLIQAAPGKLLEVVDLYKAGWPGSKDSGDEPPIAMRHSQGDRWDLLLLFPMGSFGEYYAAESDHPAGKGPGRGKGGSGEARGRHRVAGGCLRLRAASHAGPGRAREGRLLPYRDVRRTCPARSPSSTASGRWRTPT